jgi:TonB family protein
MRIRMATLILVARVFAQSAESHIPIVRSFVAPAYPRAAKDRRISGTTLTLLTIDRTGVVTEVKTIRAHPVFEAYVSEALKKWRFEPSGQQLTLQVTCSFEVNDECEGTDKHPVTSETKVAAELPTVVHIKTGFQCVEHSVAEKQ